MPTFRRLFESRLFASLGCVCEPPAAAAPRKGWDTDDPPEASTSCLPDIGASKAYGAIPNDKLDKASAEEPIKPIIDLKANPNMAETVELCEFLGQGLIITGIVLFQFHSLFAFGCPTLELGVVLMDIPEAFELDYRSRAFKIFRAALGAATAAAVFQFVWLWAGAHPKTNVELGGICGSVFLLTAMVANFSAHKSIFTLHGKISWLGAGLLIPSIMTMEVLTYLMHVHLPYAPLWLGVSKLVVGIAAPILLAGEYMEWRTKGETCTALFKRTILMEKPEGETDESSKKLSGP